MERKWKKKKKNGGEKNMATKKSRRIVQNGEKSYFLMWGGVPGSLLVYDNDHTDDGMVSQINRSASHPGGGARGLKMKKS